MDQQFQQVINHIVEQTLDAPPFANLTRPQYDQKKQEIHDFFQELMANTLFDNLNEVQLEEANNLDLASPEAGKKFALWAAEIPNFLFIYEQNLKKYSENIRLTGQTPILE